MGLLDFLLGDDSSSNNGRDHDRSVFDTDRFRNNGSGNWVDWEDVSTGSYKGDGFEHPNFDDDGEWSPCNTCQVTPSTMRSLKA